MTESQVKQALKDMGYEDLEIEEELDKWSDSANKDAAEKQYLKDTE